MIKIFIINKDILSNRCSHSDLSADYSSGESVTLFLSCHRRSHTLETLSFFRPLRKACYIRKYASRGTQKNNSM